MVSSVRFFLKRSPTLWALYFRGPASLLAVRVNDGSATLQLHGGVVPRYMCRYGLVGWLESVLRFYRVHSRGIEHRRCRHDGDAECEWQVTWE